jgi:hypothetical protein
MVSPSRDAALDHPVGRVYVRSQSPSGVSKLPPFETATTTGPRAPDAAASALETRVRMSLASPIRLVPVETACVAT